MTDVLNCESWADVKGYEGLYQVHPLGSVRSVDRVELLAGRHPTPHLRTRLGREIQPHLGKAGYLQVGLYKDGVCERLLVHRLVALAFVPNPKGKSEVNHIDECKTNNRSGNLEWCTRSENALHSSYKNRGSRSGKSILCEDEVEDIVKYLKEGVSQTELANWYGVTNHTIHKIKSGKNWAWLTGLDKEGVL